MKTDVLLISELEFSNSNLANNKAQPSKAQLAKARLKAKLGQSDRFLPPPVLDGKSLKMGCIQLNSPSNLNALTVDMVNGIYQQLQDWESQEEIVCVFIDSVIEKAFCAGGDVLSIYRQGKEGNEGKEEKESNETSYKTPELAKQFFASEYRNNLYIHKYPKPIIFWGDGLVLGGGLGLLANGAIRIGTEKSKFAWPEIKIGLFPDVGGGFFLSQLPSPLANLIGMFGVMVNSAEAKEAKLIDFLVAQEFKQDYIDALLQTDGSFKQLKRATSRLQSQGLDRFAENRFDHESRLFVAGGQVNQVAEILMTYEGENPLIIQAKENLQYGSKTTAKLFSEQRLKCVGKDYQAVVELEFKMACECTRQPDFYEGMRALLDEKTLDPKWQTNQFDAELDGYFENEFNIQDYW